MTIPINSCSLLEILRRFPAEPSPWPFDFLPSPHWASQTAAPMIQQQALCLPLSWCEQPAKLHKKKKRCWVCWVGFGENLVGLIQRKKCPDVLAFSSSLLINVFASLLQLYIFFIVYPCLDQQQLFDVIIRDTPGLQQRQGANGAHASASPARQLGASLCRSKRMLLH